MNWIELNWIETVLYLRLRFRLIEVGISLIDFLLFVSSANSSAVRFTGTSRSTSSSYTLDPSSVPSRDKLLIEAREPWFLFLSVLRIPCLNAFSDGRPLMERKWWLGMLFSNSSSSCQWSSSSSSSYPALAPPRGWTWTMLEALLWYVSVDAIDSWDGDLTRFPTLCSGTFKRQQTDINVMLNVVRSH